MPLPVVPLVLGGSALGIGAGLFGIKTLYDYENKPESRPQLGPGIELLNAHLEDIRQQRQQRIRAELSGDLGLTPEWADRVAVARADDKYQNWLKQSQGFELGDKVFKWVEADTPEGQRYDIANSSSDDIANRMSRMYTKDPGQYQGSYENLINEKQRLTGKRYIPVRVR